VNLFHVHIVNGPVIRHYFIAADDQWEAERYLPLDIVEAIHGPDGSAGGFDHYCVNDVTGIDPSGNPGVKLATICDSRKRSHEH
jgi:hypothetical protein